MAVAGGGREGDVTSGFGPPRPPGRHPSPWPHPRQLAVPEQGAEQGFSHVHGHALTNVRQQHQVSEGQQSLKERPALREAPGRLLRAPGPPIGRAVPEHRRVAAAGY